MRFRVISFRSNTSTGGVVVGVAILALGAALLVVGATLVLGIVAIGGLAAAVTLAFRRLTGRDRRNASLGPWSQGELEAGHGARSGLDPRLEVEQPPPARPPTSGPAPLPPDNGSGSRSG